MTRHHYYVGTRGQDGVTVSSAHWGEVEGFLLAVYGGFTRYEATGAWQNETQTVYEPSVVYEGMAQHAYVCPRIVASRLAVLAHQSAVLWTEESLAVGLAYAKS